jgi:hypothetical protein
MKRTVACVFALMLLSASSCGDPTDTGDADGPGEAVSATVLTADEQKAAANLKPMFGVCVATGLVDRVGIEKLREYRLLNDDLSASESEDFSWSERDANTFADVQLECEDYKDFVAAMVNPEGPEAPVPDSDPYISGCTDAVTEADVHEFLVTLWSGGDFESESLPFNRKLQQQGCGWGG